MNSDQKANLDTSVRALGQTLAAAWSYFHLLRGIDQGRRQSPAVVERFGTLYDRTWRAIFDGLFAKIGALLDNTRGTQSLPNLIILIRRYRTPDLKQLLPEVESQLSIPDSALSKHKNWRHSAVAHHAADREHEFYATNRMTLTEIEGALVKLEELLNHLSWNVLAIHNDTRSGFEGLVEDGKSLFALAAAGIRIADAANRNSDK